MSAPAALLDGIVLLGHGSRDAAGAREFRALADLVAAQAGGNVAVEPGFLEFAGQVVPSIPEAFGRCVARGARRIAAVPLLLFAGGHGTEDMPREVEVARQRHPTIDIALADVLGIDDGVLDRLVERADAAVADLPPVSAASTHLLLVTSGSAWREANSDVFKAARLLQDRAGGRPVEVAFLRLARPYLQDGMARCAQLGARRVVVLPLLLNTGLLARRVTRKLVWLRREFPGIEIIETPHLGLDRVVIDAIGRRAAAAFGRPEAPNRATPVYLAPGQERCRPPWNGDPSPGWQPASPSPTVSLAVLPSPEPAGRPR